MTTRIMRAAVIGVIAWAAAAAVPEAADAQAVRACYNKAGVLYIIGVPNQPDECRGGDVELSWSVQGPQGEKGDQGEQGEKGDQGDQGPAGTSSAVSFVTAVNQLRPPSSFMPLLSTQFTTSAQGPAVVSFYANVAQLTGFSNGGLLFRLMVDGAEIVTGNRIRSDFESADRDAQMIGFDWAVDLAAGSHDVTVEWLGLCCSPNTGDNATVDSRSLIVRHPG